MEFVYQFVTEGKFNAANRDANLDLLDRGTLYVARFEANGKMRWLPLVHGQGPLTAANGFHSQADVVIEARRAGTLLGATPMDRPEDVEANPASGRVYVVMTFNEQRRPDQINPANPRAGNKWGHIVEIVPPLVNGRPDHAATECDWGFFIVAGNPADPSHNARYPNAPTANGWVCAPDNVAFDPKGRIWISTDGQDDAGGFNDSLYAAATSGPARGATRAFFVGPRGSEICGPEFTPDGRTLFLSIQHPGDGSTFDKPSTRWPDFNPGLPPRGAVVAITKADGGEIGS
jgi:secreted PhoX family phosphatase